MVAEVGLGLEVGVSGERSDTKADDSGLVMGCSRGPEGVAVCSLCLGKNGAGPG